MILFYIEMLPYRFGAVLENKVLFFSYTQMIEIKVLDFMSLDWGVFAKYIMKVLKKGPL